MSEQEILLNGKSTEKKPKCFVNIWGIVAGVAVFVSVLVPYLSMTIFDEKIDLRLMESDGMILSIIIRATAVLGILFSALGINITNIIAGLLSLAIWVMNYAGIVKFLKKAEEVGEEAAIHYEKGFYLLLAGAICFIFAGIYGMVQRKRDRSGDTGKERQKSPYRSLIAIPIQLVIDILAVIGAFYYEMGSRPEGVLGHPSGMITVFFAMVMFVITVVVAVISLIVMAVRLKKKEKEEA